MNPVPKPGNLPAGYVYKTCTELFGEELCKDGAERGGVVTQANTKFKIPGDTLCIGVNISPCDRPRKFNASERSTGDGAKRGCVSLVPSISKKNALSYRKNIGAGVIGTVTVEPSDEWQVYYVVVQDKNSDGVMTGNIEIRLR